MSLLHIGGSGGSGGTSVVSAEGVDFDGTYDYLSRSTDLVGNVDSKTFTFSAWVYPNVTIDYQIIYEAYNADAQQGFKVYYHYSLNKIYIRGGVLGADYLYAQVSVVPPKDTYFNLLVSIDLTNVANRYVYINDNLASVTWSVYNNNNIDFTSNVLYVAKNMANNTYLKGRLSNIFLDYTYRNLSIESNRRLFITADGKPTPTATLSALNPILYLPLKDSATATQNLGTGGNFTANGTFATSNRGANQDNCVASYFDGAADYLSRVNNIPNSYVLTASFCIKNSAIDGSGSVVLASDIGAITYQMRIQFSATNRLVVLFRDTVGSSSIGYIDLTLPNITKNSMTVSMSFDFNKLASACAQVSVNGTMYYPDMVGYTQGTLINFASSVATRIGMETSTNGAVNGDLGELYFDTKYIDLATSNPFWDSVENKPVPVRKVIANTGVTPLIAMPIRADMPGKNYGTGGDFTANSAPYVGARGASEFWARSALKPAGTGNYLNKGSFSGISVVDFNFVVSIRVNASGVLEGYTPFRLLGTSGSLSIKTSTSPNYYIAIGSSETQVSNTFPMAIGSWVTIMVSRVGGVVKVYVNGANVSNGSNGGEFSEIGHSTSLMYTWENTTSYTMSNCYFCHTGGIDFSQEVNRLKFVDGLGYPLDLKKQIEAGVIPKPLIYLPFDDPTNLGKNLGTGGAFNVIGTVTQGSDVLG